MPYERKRVKCAVPDCPHYFKKRSEVAKYCYTCREKIQREQSRVGMAKLRAERRAQTQKEKTVHPKRGAVSQSPEIYFEKGMVAQNAGKPTASFKAIYRVTNPTEKQRYQKCENRNPKDQTRFKKSEVL